MIKLDQLTRASRLVGIALLAIALAACGNQAEEQALAEKAAAARAELTAGELLQHLDAAVADNRPDLARAFGEDLLNKYPATAAARAVTPRMGALRDAADAAIEAKRLRELWAYHDVADTESDGRVRTAFIYATTQTMGVPAVRLVLRRHASWGQSAYLLITDGDFACQGACSMHVSADDGEPTAFAISRAKDNVPPAVFIDNDADLIAKLEAAKRLTLRIKLAPARETTLLFEVGEFDPSRLREGANNSAPASERPDAG